MNKKILLSLYLFLNTFFLFSIITIPSCGKCSVEFSTNERTLESFNIIASWYGSNGEVIKNIKIDNNYVIANSGINGIIFFDFSQKTNIIDSFRITNEENENYIYNDFDILEISSKKYLFAALKTIKKQGAIGIYDITYLNKIRKRILNKLSKQINPLAISIDYLNKKLFIADEKYLLNIYDIIIETNSLNFIKLEFITNLYLYKFRSDISIKFLTNFILISANRNGAYIINPTNYNIIHHFYNPIIYVNNINFYNNNIIISDRISGVSIYKFDKKNKPTINFTYESQGDCYDSIMINYDLYIADGINGLLKLDYHKDMGYSLIKQYLENFITYSVAFDKNSFLLFLGCGKDGLKILEP